MTGILAKSGFDIETRNKMNGNTALILSCKNGRVEHVALLLNVEQKSMPKTNLVIQH